MSRTLSFARFAWPVAVLPLTLLTLAGAGCGGGDSTPSSGVPLQDYEHRYGDAECAFAAKCGLMPDAATCKRVVAPDPNVAQTVASVVFGSLGYDPVAAQACITAIQGSDCQSQSGSTFSKTVTDACNKVFTGLQPNGGPCFVGAECTSGKCKAPAMCTDSCCLGTCDDLGNAIAIGMPCGGMDQAGKLCVSGSYCDSKMMQCTALKNANEACPQDDACVPGQVCDTGGTGVCFQAAASGAKCNPMLKADPCLEFNQFCDMTQASCIAIPSPGQPCSNPGNLCQKDSICKDMVCTLLAIEGEACGNGGKACLGSLKCSGDDKTAGMCLPFDGSSTCVRPQ